MTSQIAAIRETRSFLLEQLKDLTTEQFNRTAEGFNNNIIWNLGHMIAVQQGICYKRAGLPTLISDDFWQRFKSGSKPKGIISDDEIVSIKQLLIITLDQLETDYNKQVFGNYTTWVTRNGVELVSIDDGIKFLSFHEGLHSGVIMAIKRLVI
ncbi:MAG TPA: DinB family protein [Patescibacteria group bacterium]